MGRCLGCASAGPDTPDQPPIPGCRQWDGTRRPMAASGGAAGQHDDAHGRGHGDGGVDRSRHRLGHDPVEHPLPEGLDDPGGAPPGRAVLRCRSEPDRCHRVLRCPPRDPHTLWIRRSMAGALGVHRPVGAPDDHPGPACHRPRHRGGGHRSRRRPVAGVHHGDPSPVATGAGLLGSPGGAVHDLRLRGGLAAPL